MKRLSINVAPVTQDALQRFADQEGVSVTEALRRLVAYGDVVYSAADQGKNVLLEKDGKTERLLIV